MSSSSSIKSTRSGSQRDERKEWAIKRAANRVEEELEDEVRRLEIEELRVAQERRSFKRRTENMVLNPEELEDEVRRLEIEELRVAQERRRCNRRMENMVLDAKLKAAEDCDASYVTVDAVEIESSPSGSRRGGSAGYAQSAQETRSGPQPLDEQNPHGCFIPDEDLDLSLDHGSLRGKGLVQKNSPFHPAHREQQRLPGEKLGLPRPTSEGRGVFYDQPSAYQLPRTAAEDGKAAGKERTRRHVGYHTSRQHSWRPDQTPSARDDREPAVPRSEWEPSVPQRADFEVGPERCRWEPQSPQWVDQPIVDKQDEPTGYDIKGWLSDASSQPRMPPPMPEQPVQPTQQFGDLINALRAPRIEMKKFNGDPLEYARFVRAFEINVQRVCRDPAELVVHLYNSCEGEAATAVEPYINMPAPHGWLEATKALRRRYGGETLVSNKWLDKLAASKARTLRQMADEWRSCLTALSSLGRVSEMNSGETLRRLMTKMPGWMQGKWRVRVQKIREAGRCPDFPDMVMFMERQAEAQDDPVFGVRPATTQQRSGAHQQSSLKKHGESAFATAGTDMSCPFCEAAHGLVSCRGFKEASPEDRWKMVKEHSLCFACLEEGHSIRDCSRKKTCREKNCTSHHHYLLHGPRQPGKRRDGKKHKGQQQQQQETPPQVQPKAEPKPKGEKSCYVSSGKVALPIVPVKVSVPGQEREVTTFALLDTGSTLTFCGEKLLKRLGIKGEKTTLKLSTMSKQNGTSQCRVASLKIAAMDGSTEMTINQVHSVPKLPISTDNIATVEQTSRWDHLADLPLHHPKDVQDTELLIGANCPEALITTDVATGAPGEPYGVQTSLGWAVAGPVADDGIDQSHTTNCIVTHGDPQGKSLDQRLEEKLDRLWELETGVYDTARGRSQQDEAVLRRWEKEVMVVDKHYQLPIPFKQEHPSLPDARGMAMKRLESLRRKLEKNPVLRKQYADGMQALLTKGFAVKVPAEDLTRQDGAVWYLPHHPVINANKDKPRIVFDCAARHGGVSLNSQVCSGPDLTNSLVGVLLRFRRQPVAFMGDVEAMFHQVKVEPQQQDALRFLWWPGGDVTRAPETYKMTVHLFGGTWSPSCCAFALQQAAKDSGSDFHPDTVKAVEQSFYVDDCLQSVATTEEAILQVQELTQMLGQRGFVLKKWVSNSRQVMESIALENRSKKANERELEAPLEERALGVFWNVDQDAFTYRTQGMEKPLTKRGLLSMLSSVYDPLGFASPFILKARQIVQDLCRLKLDWDAPVPPSHKRAWHEWTCALQEMQTVTIPRCIQPRSHDVKDRRLHHFADASETAYGVVTYLRTEYEDGQVSCVLTMAKSRLAPLKSTTIPRLELCAATLAARQDELLRRELDFPLEPSQFWTDSTIVLWYIQHEEKRFQTFVANRVSQIRERSEPAQWRHVPTDHNPADDASRGALPAVLADKRWVEGPAFLKQQPEQWPTWEPTQPAQDSLEVKEEPVTLATVNAEECPVDRLVSRYSSWPRLLRGVARVLCVKQALRHRQPIPRELQREHLEEAENALLRYIQRSTYAKEIAQLQAHGRVRKSSKLARLSPQLRNGLLVTIGRLKHAQLPHPAKTPVILPKNHHVSDLLIRHLHERSAHAGRDYLLSELRQRYWVIGATTAVKRILHRCVTCRRREARPCEQMMADLPEDRVTPGGSAFTNVGVDYFGPFLVRRGRGTDTRYGCLFTCLVTRAIHVEVASSLSTSAFINCLQRFMARRGKPKLMRSDNGKNFVGADRELRRSVQQLNSQRLRQRLLDLGIEWRFNPPSASHMGGVWERQIRTVRRVMAGLTREQVLAEDDLHTFLTAAEGIVNNRPITPASADPNDLEALTPNHLLLMRPAALVPLQTDQTDLYRRNWRQVQYLADLFWKRWSREYLPLLRARTKWTEPHRNIKEGDVVILVDQLQPRSRWPLGRVTAALPGEDGLVRTARVKTASTELTRPVSKLCLLEAAC